MKYYLIHNSRGAYVKFIVLKNTADKININLLGVLAVDRTPKEKDFVNTTFFFTNKEKEALVIKSRALADYMTHKIEGYAEEIEV